MVRKCLKVFCAGGESARTDRRFDACLNRRLPSMGSFILGMLNFVTFIIHQRAPTPCLSFSLCFSFLGWTFSSPVCCRDGLALSPHFRSDCGALFRRHTGFDRSSVELASMEGRLTIHASLRHVRYDAGIIVASFAYLAILVLLPKPFPSYMPPSLPRP